LYCYRDTLHVIEGPDGALYVSAVKFTAVVTGRAHNLARDTLNGLLRSEVTEKRATAEKILHRKVQETGFEYMTWLITYSEAIKLVRLLPAKYTGKIIDYLDQNSQEVDAGAPAVIQRAQQNAVSNAPRNVLARDGLGMQAVVPVDNNDSVLGKRMIAWGDTRDVINKTYRASLTLISDAKAIQQDLGMLTTDMKKIISNDVQRLCTQCMMCETLVDSIYITNGPQTGEIMDVQTAVTFRPIDIRQTVERLGYTVVGNDLSVLGTKFKVAYVEKYGPTATPPFTTEMVTLPNGKTQPLPVNQYLEKDINMVECVIHAFYANKAAAVAAQQEREQKRAEKAASAARKKEEAATKKEEAARKREMRANRQTDQEGM
jgi:hypothetical protein